MKAAFLLVTSAWLAGQTTPAPGTKPGPAPGPAPVTSAAPAVVSSSGPGCTNCGGGGYVGGFYGGGCCDTGCNDCCHTSRFSRFRGLFNRHNRGCCDSCFDTCNSCCGGYTTYSSCNSCNSCNDCCGSSGGLFGRFRGLFNRHNRGCCDTGCCDTGCSSGCSGCAGGSSYVPGGTINPTPGSGGEVITNPPKKMPGGTPPAGKDKGAAPKEVRINNAPVTGAPIAPATPNIEVAPPAVPNLDADRKEPF